MWYWLRAGYKTPPVPPNSTPKPEVEIQIGRERRQGRCRVVDPSDPDYASLWKTVNENNGDRYAEYQSKTSRPIPVVVITPA